MMKISLEGMQAVHDPELDYEAADCSKL